MVTYTDQVDGIAASQLVGFFEGWPEHPDQATHLRILKQSSHVVLAKDGDRIIGFITAVSDNVLCAYVPLLEVLPDYRRQGVGKELVRLMLLKLGDLYMIDVTCDSELRPFYLSMGMSAMTAMCKRNYQNQAGKLD
ncbi:MAG: GNAT family N-acetyltransferase [Fimbriimonadaceae bacterium]|nr:MAG: GNAT family N-acetyltransferase [Fimbriimonadaceae bacterium]